MFIYKITNTANGKVLIGQTINNIRFRWNSYRSLLRNNKYKNDHLQAAWNKYGEESFTFEIIDRPVFEHSLDVLETFWIKFYDSMNREKGYNKTSGGNLKKQISDETRLKKSKSIKCKNQATGEEFFFKSQNDACDTLKIHPSALSRMIKDKGLSANGFKASRCNEDYKPENSNYEKYSKAQKLRYLNGDNPHNAQAVLCLTNNTLYRSFTEAARLLKIDRHNIAKVCQGLLTDIRGFKFQLTNKEAA